MQIARTSIYGLASLVFTVSIARGQGVDTLLYKPATSPRDLLSVQRADVAHKFGVGFALGWADDPLVEKRRGERAANLVDDQVVGEVLGTMTFWNRLEVGLGVPFVLYQTSTGTPATGTVEPDSQSLGDLRLIPKFVFGRMAGIGLAAALPLTFPTSGDQYVGDRTVTATPKAIVDWEVGPLAIATNLGVRLRGDTDVPGLEEVGPEFVFGAGAMLDVGNVVGIPAALIGELYGAAGGNRSDSPAELLAGGRIGLPLGFVAQLAAGAGVVPGYGASDMRVVAAVHYEPPEPPPPAPTPPPDPDPDRDGILGVEDRCPRDAEDRDNFQDDDGCPDADNDADGIPDVSDQCANEAEDKDGFKDEDGCPDPDNDADGIVDASDKCPDQAEVLNGVDDEDGCPDEAKVVVRAEKIEILEKVHFKTASARIRDDSNAVLNDVANALKKFPHILKIQVEGHTDDVGSENYNLRLSQRRADSVVAYLVKQGIEAERLIAKGFGKTRPLEQGDAKEVRAKNRRVEFVIIERKSE